MNIKFSQFVDDATEGAKRKLFSMGADKTWWDQKISIDLVTLKILYDREMLQQAIDDICNETYDDCVARNNKRQD